MARADVSWFVAVLLVVTAHTHIRARAEDGPAPVNTSRSLSAGADDDIVMQGDVDTPSTGHPAGTYMGVVPGSHTPPPAAGPASKGPTTITWPGFQMRPDGTSRVFVQSTGPLTPQPTAAPGKYLLHLPGARVAAETNRLPLDTRYFNTPVTKVSLSVDRSGATLVLELRADVTPSVSSEQGNTGYYFTYIELPKGSYVGSPEHAKVAAANAPPPPAAANSKATFAPSSVTKHLDGEVSAQPERNIDAELPPAVKASGQVRGGIKLKK